MNKENLDKKGLGLESEESADLDSEHASIEEENLVEETDDLIVSNPNDAENEKDVDSSIENEDPANPSEDSAEDNADIFAHNPVSEFDWWPDLSDLDRLNVINAPLEDRARLLSAKVSMSIEHTMQSISRKKLSATR